MKKVLLAVLALVFAIWCLWGLFIGVTMAYDYFLEDININKLPKELICWVGVFPVYAICLRGAISYSERQKHTKPRR